MWQHESRAIDVGPPPEDAAECGDGVGLLNDGFLERTYASGAARASRPERKQTRSLSAPTSRRKGVLRRWFYSARNAVAIALQGGMCKMFADDTIAAGQAWLPSRAVVGQRVRRVFQGVCVVLVFVALYLAVFAFHTTPDFNRLLPERPFLPCDPTPINVVPDILSVVKKRSREDGVFCSTQRTVFPLPCVCCIDGETCFRSVTIKHNDSRLGTVVDDIKDWDGTPRRLLRRIPTHAMVCTTRVGEVSPTCRSEDGPDISAYLRAQEKLFGWPAQGSPLPMRVASTWFE